AEQRLWLGSLDEALQLARRGLALQEAAGEGSANLDRVLLARVYAARGDLASLRDLLATLTTDAQFGEDDAAGRASLDILKLVANGASADVWESVLASTESLFVQLRLELWALAHREKRLSAARAAQARDVAASDPIWRQRLDVFEVSAPT